MFQNEQIMSAFYNDTDHCLCLSGDRNDHRNGSSNRHSGNEAEMEDHVHGLTNIPMMNAEIVMGVSLMLLFIAFHMTLGSAPS